MMRDIILAIIRFSLLKYRKKYWSTLDTAWPEDFVRDTRGSQRVKLEQIEILVLEEDSIDEFGFKNSILETRTLKTSLEIYIKRR